MKEELAWIDTYLLGKPSTVNEAFKKDSPLAHLMALDSVEQTSGLYGKLHNGYLIPETVYIESDSLTVGLFEVTNAQFKSFDKAFSYTQGHDNFPAIVEKSKALDYLKWLSEVTGEKYRLPNDKEAKTLHRYAHKAAKQENTLNAWAGYDIVPSDAKKLMEKVKTINSTLLKPVGSSKGYKIKSTFIYDLGGNAAEYYSDGVYGYSAYDYYDSNDQSMIPSTIVGFRIVKE
jgi:formylglycine-generating enzyme required for sulfatase activity